jgi:hypothetical protein
MDTSKILIITVNEIKNDSKIDITADDKTLRELVVLTQEIKLNPILGDTLYLSVLSAIYYYDQNSIAIPTSIVNLLPYIKKFLLYQVIADFIYVNHYKLTNKGTVKLTDSNATSASNTDIEWYKNFYDSATLSYKKKLIDYLRLNDLTTETNIDKDFTFSGIYMDIEPKCEYVSTETVSNTSDFKTYNYIKVVATENSSLIYQILTTDDLVSVDNSGGFTDVSVKLPTASSCSGHRITIKIYDSTTTGYVGISTNGESFQNVDGTFVVFEEINNTNSVGGKRTFQSNGTDWEIVS